MLIVRAAVRLAMGVGAVIVCGRAVAVGRVRMGPSRLMIARLMVMRRLPMVMRRRLMMRSSLMVRLGSRVAVLVALPTRLNVLLVGAALRSRRLCVCHFRCLLLEMQFEATLPQSAESCMGAELS